MGQANKPKKSNPAVPVVTHSALRKRVTDLSAPTLLRIHALPKFLVPGLIAVLMLLGLFLQAPYSGIALTVVSFFIGWLMYLSWPLLDPRSRIIRFFVFLILIAATAIKFGA
ncbi:MAG: hypothetical protein EBU89_02860 [Actinobacteria bacterium]|jgi:hypothetical protein|nr:hypothetical protein [Actinomycetota bacterium]NBO34866.1 hypothetical protein [Actinomycetota bacterium]